MPGAILQTPGELQPIGVWTHIPPVQAAVWQPSIAAHLRPQPPQLALSELVSTHVPVQKLNGAVQIDEQEPPTHVVPAPQVIPHTPQLLLFELVSTQTPLHGRCPVGQFIVHVPDMQLMPVGHLVPHAPQLLLSVCQSTHAPLHAI